MLKTNVRTILHYDLIMKPLPDDAPIIPLADVMPKLDERVGNGLSFQSIDNDKRMIRISEMRHVKTSGGTKAVALLFTLGDSEKADPGFTNLQTGKVRIERPEDDEAGGLSVHTVVSLEPTKKGGATYRMAFEDVNGFGRSLIQAFLRHEFKLICDELGSQYTRPGGNIVKTRPLVELLGCQSEKIKNSLREGRLLHVQLVQPVVSDLGFDELKYVKTARRNLVISVARELPQGESLTFLEKLKLFAKKKSYETMNIRWREEGFSKPRTAQVSTAKADAGEALFVRSDEIELDKSLPEISPKLSDELVKKMKNFVEGG